MSNGKQSFRVDIGRWELRREDGESVIDLHPCGPNCKYCQREPEPPSKTDQKLIAEERRKRMLQMLESGEVKNRSELASVFGLSRARISQILGPKKESGG